MRVIGRKQRYFRDSSVNLHYKLFTKCFCFAAEHNKSSWFFAATTVTLYSQIDESVLYITFDVFAAVEIYVTAK